MIDSMCGNSRPNFGMAQVPPLGCAIQHALAMEIAETLQRNLQALMKHRKLTILDIVLLAREKNIALTNGTVGRIYAGTAVGMSKLDDLAAALGLEPWQLLFPKFDPTTPADAARSREEVARAARAKAAQAVTDAIEDLMSEVFEDSAPVPLDEGAGPRSAAPPPKPLRDKMLPRRKKAST